MCSFEEVLGGDFYRIRAYLEAGVRKIGYEFDEDLFIDVCEKCLRVLRTKDLTRQEYSKYLYVSYINTLRRTKSKEIITQPIDDNYDMVDETYNEYKDKLYNSLTKAIEEKFGVNISRAWELHICHDMSYKELEHEFPGMKFNFEFKRIKKYILTRLVKEDPNIKELLMNLYD